MANFHLVFISTLYAEIHKIYKCIFATWEYYLGHPLDRDKINVPKEYILYSLHSYKKKQLCIQLMNQD